MNESPMPIVLASSSPRRRKIFDITGIVYHVIHPDVNERVFQNIDPYCTALWIAASKALDAFKIMAIDTAVRAVPCCIFAADTIVVVDNEILGKPADRKDAFTMLSKLAGREHQVITAVALFKTDESMIVYHDKATVKMHSLSEALIYKFIESGEADDKAGAYSVQGMGASFIAEVQGDLSCVIGFPLGLIQCMAKKTMNWDPFSIISPKKVLLNAFPEIIKLPFTCLEGIPD